jgi:hypothetical protein
MPQVPHVVLLCCLKLIPKDVGPAQFWNGKGKTTPGGCPLFILHRKFHKTTVLERKVEIQSFLSARKEDRDRPNDAPDDGDPSEQPEEEEERAPPKDRSPHGSI